MGRLNNRAYQILLTEIQKCTKNDPLSKLEQKMLLEEIEKLRAEKGSPVTTVELRKLIIPTYPKFSEKIFQKAAQANLKTDGGGALKFLAGVVVAVSGLIIMGGVGLFILASFLSSTESKPATQNSTQSEPAAKNSPTPSDPTPAAMSTEEHYQQAKELLDQTETLINQAIGTEDLALSEEQLTKAKKHIDQLPASQTVSSSQTVTTRRKKKQRYQQSYVQHTTYEQRDERFAAIRSRFEQMQAQVFQKKQSLVADHQKNNTLIQAAKQFSWEAAKAGQNPPHSTAKWQEIENLWSEAIRRLGEIPVGNPGYAEAQKLMASYQANLGNVQTRRKVEEESLQALESAQRQIESLLAQTPTDANSVDRNRTISSIQSIINELEKVQKGTTAYQKAQELLLSAKNKLKQLQP
jgi:hypothetical protein